MVCVLLSSDASKVRMSEGECEREMSQKVSKPPAQRSGHRPWMVHDVLGPRAGDESQNWVWRKWPLGWLRQHVLISRGGGNGQDIDGGLGHED
jgi:hypothetical protein